MDTPRTDGIATSERVSAAFLRLKASAKNINGISEQLNSQISALEAALERINVGVGCWATISKGSNEREDEHWSHDVGYSLLRGRWCIAVRTVKSVEWRTEDDITEWPFDEAPRYLLPKAVDRLPDLIESLVAATDAASARLQEKVGPAQELVAAITNVALPKKK